MKELPLIEPRTIGKQEFEDPQSVIDAVQDIYSGSVRFLCRHLEDALAGKQPAGRYRAYYPEISITTTRHSRVDSRLAYGFVVAPGTYATTLTRPRLFSGYLHQQVSLLLRNHGAPITVGVSRKPIPVHFAIGSYLSLEDVSDFGNSPVAMHRSPGFSEEPEHDDDSFPLRDYFDVPDLATISDEIINCTADFSGLDVKPLAPFSAERVDYSLARLSHYTSTDPVHFQNHVLFTNYQFYVDEFVRFSRVAVGTDSGYTALVLPGNRIVTDPDEAGDFGGSLPQPQMPAYHLKRANASGISLVNIGVGPSNAKTATDHIAVLRPRAWLMLGHCAGLRSSQNIGDYVLAHAYVREDHVLDADLPVWVPVPALAEVQIALESAVEEITELPGFEFKRVMRTGTVATIDNRNWELRHVSGPVQRLSQSRAIALDMESATVAANGFRFRVPYGTLLCVSDKPLHGELKLPGTATAFYQRQVNQHLKIGIRAMEIIREMPLERLHSRKLRSFDETAFL